MGTKTVTTCDFEGCGRVLRSREDGISVHGELRSPGTEPGERSDQYDQDFCWECFLETFRNGD